MHVLLIGHSVGEMQEGQRNDFGKRVAVEIKNKLGVLEKENLQGRQQQFLGTLQLDEVGIREHDPVRNGLLADGRQPRGSVLLDPHAVGHIVRDRHMGADLLLQATVGDRHHMTVLQDVQNKAGLVVFRPSTAVFRKGKYPVVNVIDEALAQLATYWVS